LPGKVEEAGKRQLWHIAERSRGVGFNAETAWKELWLREPMRCRRVKLEASKENVSNVNLLCNWENAAERQSFVHRREYILVLRGPNRFCFLSYKLQPEQFNGFNPAAANML
jgi:hypothetical protein